MRKAGIGIRSRNTIAAEARMLGTGQRRARMPIPAFLIGLPDLNQCASDRNAFAIGYRAEDFDTRRRRVARPIGAPHDVIWVRACNDRIERAKYEAGRTRE